MYLPSLALCGCVIVLRCRQSKLSRPWLKWAAVRRGVPGIRAADLRPEFRLA